MSRPKKGQKGYEEANAKWRASMIARLGSEEALKEWQRNLGRKGGQAGKGSGYGGGFSSTKVGADGLTGYDRARIYGAVGGRRSKRGKAKKSTNKE